MIEIISGDLLEAPEQYIAHQCNCVSAYASGLAKAIFNKFTYADSYKNRVSNDTPGTIAVFGNGESKRYIINMYAQFWPGKANKAKAALDTSANRIDYFNKCLDAIASINNLQSIAFPFCIGCGLAGGDWTEYLAALNIFNDKVKSFCKVKIYKPNFAASERPL